MATHLSAKRQLVIVALVCGAFVGAGILFIALVIYADINRPRHTPAGDKFDVWLRAELSKSSNELDLANLVSFDWQQVCMYSPYGHPETDDPNDGIPDDMPWTLNESLWGLVFFTEGKNYVPVSIGREVLSFDSQTNGRCYCGDVKLILTKAQAGGPPGFTVQGERCEQFPFFPKRDGW